MSVINFDQSMVNTSGGITGPIYSCMPQHMNSGGRVFCDMSPSFTTVRYLSSHEKHALPLTYGRCVKYPEGQVYGDSSVVNQRPPYAPEQKVQRDDCLVENECFLC